MLVRLVDTVEGVGRVELERPAGGGMRHGDEVVAEDHLGDGDADAGGEVVYRPGLGYGELAGRDAEGRLGVRLGCCSEGGWMREGLVNGSDVIHCGGRLRRGFHGG